MRFTKNEKELIGRHFHSLDPDLIMFRWVEDKNVVDSEQIRLMLDNDPALSWQMVMFLRYIAARRLEDSSEIEFTRFCLAQFRPIKYGYLLILDAGPGNSPPNQWYM